MPQPAGSTLLVSGTCTGNFYIDKSLTLSGPATLDGGGVPTQYGSTLNVTAGTVVLNNLVIQDGVGIDNIGGGLWNSGAVDPEPLGCDAQHRGCGKRRVQPGSVDPEQFDGVEQHIHLDLWQRRHLQLWRQR